MSTRAWELSPQGSALQRWRKARGESPDRLALWQEGVVARLRSADRPPELATLAMEIARWAPEAYLQAVHLLALVTLVDVSEGSTQTLVDGSRFAVKLQSVAPPGAEGLAAVADALALLESPEAGGAALSSTSTVRAPLVLESGSLQLERMAYLEARLAARLLGRGGSRHNQGVSETFNELLLRSPGAQQLSVEQREAVMTAAHRRLTVITGGPGTGKTSVVVVLLELLQALGMSVGDIALCAPTGKATHRLATTVKARLSTDYVPRTETLHRLLGARPGRSQFRFRQDNPLPARVVICDEASMIDIELFSRLTEALESEAQLILLGDADQLPSVEAGSVLRDVVEALPHGVCTLTKSYRMDPQDPDGRDVLSAAVALHQGDINGVLSLARESSAVAFEPVTSEADRDRFFRAVLSASPLGTSEHRTRVRRIRRFVGGRFIDQEEVSQLLRATQSFQLLTITRQSTFQHGSEAVSGRIHALLAQEEGLFEDDDYLPGEPVMMLRNDYERRLFNGDVGLVLRVALEQEPARPMAVFPSESGPQPFDLTALGRDLALAHAITVHKAQGSEYDRVAVLLPEEDVPLLTREVLYTAATRARRAVVLAGQPKLLSVGMQRSIERASGLKARLTGKTTSSRVES